MGVEDFGAIGKVGADRQLVVPSNMVVLDAGKDWVLLVVRDNRGVQSSAVHNLRAECRS